MPPAAAISRQDLFTRLAQGHAAGITVVTPNHRLSRALRADFDAHQTAAGKTVWEDADILPLDAFVARCYEDALYAEGGDKLPLLLSEAQERALWEEAIRDSAWADALLNVPKTADDARRAWKTAQDWGIAGGLEKFAASEDARAFRDWARGYEKRLARGGFVDRATLPALGLTAPKTRLLVAYAFLDPRPQQEAIFSAYDTLACAPGRQKAAARRTAFENPREELAAAAAWARARLEEGKARIGVVVPELKLRRREVARVFESVMGGAGPFNLSAGEPLAGHPLVAAALTLLEFSLREIPFEAASRLLRSPFLRGAESEKPARARLDAVLRGKSRARVSLGWLIPQAEGCPALRALLEGVYAAAQREARSPHDWAERFTDLLAAAGFPGERGWDSDEFQTRTKLNEILGELARLSLVQPRMGAAPAFATLRRLCSETLFQPESGDAPVQVLEILESVDLEFDALWVGGLSDDAWPQAVRPNPFLPLALQRKAGIPEASAEASLALDRRRTEGWTRAAPEVVFSSARRVEDRDLAPSPLVAQLPEEKLEIPSFISHRESIFQARKTESRVDESAPALAVKAVRGGTRVLADQAACPFRAFARHRLRAEQLDSPEPGLDAATRGKLIHALMENVWNELKTSAALAGELRPAVEKAARAAVAQEPRLEGRLAELERQRLARLALAWLEEERKRKPFAVVKVEKDESREIGGLALQARIDRMDRLADGSHAIVDYKTGAQMTPRMWMGERPDEPQLPFYAVTSGVDVSAVAFAKFRAGDMRFMGYARAKDALPKLTHYPTWDELLGQWKASLEGLAQGFGAGEAAVDPKNGLKTCERCDLHPLCRVHEKLGALDEEEGAE